MNTFKCLAFPCLFLIFSTTGCLTNLQRHSSPADVTTATSGVVLSLTIPRLTYAPEESIPLELSIQSGAYDLLVPVVNVATSGAFTHLKVTDTNGNSVEPKRSITLPSIE